MLAELKGETSAAFLQQVQRGPDPTQGPPVTPEATAEVRDWLDRVGSVEPTDLDSL